MVGRRACQASFGLDASLGCARSFSGCQLCKDPCTQVCLGVPCWKLLWTSLSFRRVSEGCSSDLKNLGGEMGDPEFLPKHLTVSLHKLDTGLACMDLGREVWTLKSGSRLPSGVIRLVALDLAVTARQTCHFQATLKGQAWVGEKRGCPTPPTSLHSPLPASQSHQQFLSALFPVPLIFISDFSIVFAIFQETDRAALPPVLIGCKAHQLRSY